MHGSARCLPLLAVIALAALVAAPGCSRHHFRERADKDVEGIITQKNIYPDWQVKNWHVYPDSRARFADRSNPDRPPYPPDDPAARALSPNPQRPTKKSGVGRVDGEGYLTLLQQWDAQNRAEDPLPPARGVGPTAQTSPAKPFPEGRARPAIPAPKLLEGEQPAVRHAVPSGLPAAMRPTGSDAVHGPVAPITMPAMPGEFGPWVASRPSMPGPVVMDRGHGPSITELRPPIVMVAVGETEQNGKTVPAIAIMPIGGQPPAQPEKLPEPKPLTGPMPLDPKQPDPKPGVPVGVAPGGGMIVATGDPAADYLRALESGQVGYRIKLEQAVEFGLVNAREFQDRREDLYLAALPVTQERFNFAALGFFAQDAVRRSTGRELAGGGERWTLNSTGGVSKLFPTGALLLVRLANQVVVDLSGDNPTTTVGNLTLSLAQPFLRDGGRAVTLEPLTLTERNLLYAMRSYARFRKLFFVAIAGGPGGSSGYTNNPYGLQGLSQNLGRGIGGNLTAPNIGYLPLLLQQAVISNQRRNVVALERLLKIYQAYRDGGQMAQLQVDQVEVQLLNSRGQLLGQAGGGGGGGGIRGYLDALDNFKLQLGLPLTVPLELDDSPLRPIRQQLTRLEEVYAQVQAIETEATKYDRAEPVAGFRKKWLTLFTTSPLTRGTPFAKQIGDRWAAWGTDKLSDDQVRGQLTKLREERRKLLDARVERELKKQPEPPAETLRLAEVKREIDLGEFELLVRAYEAQPWIKKMGKDRDSAQDAAFALAFNAFYQVILEARNDRLLDLYRNWPELLALPVAGVDMLEVPLDDAYAAAIQTALTSRFDLMNARAQVVDAWRQIAVQANSLQGVFDVRYDLNSSTPAGGNNPVAFSGDRSSHQLTFRAELPLVRRAERNNYRAALVAYQRQRRTLMAFEDNIANDVRSDVRELRTLAQLYRIQQRVVELGYSQVDNAQYTQFAPQPFNATADPGRDAALTQQVLQAQSNLVQSQNGLYQIWVSYMTARMNLYLDIEQMPLDDRGVWCDELFNRTDGQTRPDDRQPGERLHPPRPLGNGEGR